MKIFAVISYDNENNVVEDFVTDKYEEATQKAVENVSKYEKADIDFIEYKLNDSLVERYNGSINKVYSYILKNPNYNQVVADESVVVYKHITAMG